MLDGPKPEPPDLPAYVVNPLEKQSPEALELIAAYAELLADWERAQRAEDVAAKRAADEVDEDAIADSRSVASKTDPEAYSDVPSKAYITIKETKPGYHYYWQWREGDSWANEYIGPVDSNRR